MRYPNIPEEELKIRVGEDYFSGFDHATKIGKVDFCVLPKKRSGWSNFSNHNLFFGRKPRQTNARLLTCLPS